ncbi:L-serine ammonia-lyase [Haloplasma contractile]|uniref:L-serine dehydratase n=1 Tax=Haloplasma contractile SSD-17B TaxID=1033810 RepID=U2FJH6_9MOLU|nr:L-serine ammonia-lyase [Haloplasma contractile]ERJ11414.1 L-serine dehydratase protein [Haloplasma contractile SSD-17B]
MDTLKELYKIGFGPSSSHTMGPQRAAKQFLEKTKDLPVEKFVVDLYGSLAATGIGHLTDYIIHKTLGKDRTEVVFKPETVYEFHTNGLRFYAYDQDDNLLDDYLAFSVGGGEVMTSTDVRTGTARIYKLNTMRQIMVWCRENNAELWEYVYEVEGQEILNYLEHVWNVMKKVVEDGLNKDGRLPGALQVKRRSKMMHDRYQESDVKDFDTLIYSCALAVSEENASAGKVVTAPTCGASGVLPGALYALQQVYGYSDEQIIKALAVAGLIGNLIKENASISGAEVGCQGEVGSACCMAGGAIAYLMGGTLLQIEYAAEIGLEHHLGLTCDPVNGLVQVPCIERNAIAAKRAIDAAKYSMLTDGTHIISLDKVIVTMGETGKDLPDQYKETSMGGLAKYIPGCYSYE